MQSAVGVHQVPGQPYANLIDPKYLVSASGGGANPSYITPNITPGTFGQRLYLHAPRQFFQDMELTKRFPIHEELHFNLQASFINLWNHPVFGNADGFGPYVPGASAPSFDSGVQDYSFGEGGPTNENGIYHSPLWTNHRDAWHLHLLTEPPCAGRLPRASGHSSLQTRMSRGTIQGDRREWMRQYL